MHEEINRIKIQNSPALFRGLEISSEIPAESARIFRDILKSPNSAAMHHRDAAVSQTVINFDSFLGAVMERSFPELSWHLDLGNCDGDD